MAGFLRAALVLALDVASVGKPLFAVRWNRREVWAGSPFYTYPVESVEAVTRPSAGRVTVYTSVLNEATSLDNGTGSRCSTVVPSPCLSVSG